MAIRLTNAYEKIGGQETDWDRDRFNNWGLSLNNNLAFIVEVKTGEIGHVRNSQNLTLNAWRRERLIVAIQRCGMFDRNDVGEIASRLEGQRSVDVGDWTIAKLLISKRSYENQFWFNLSLENAESFIINRVKSYPHEKTSSRMFFPDDLMQYFAWKYGGNNL